MSLKVYILLDFVFFFFLILSNHLLCVDQRTSGLVYKDARTIAFFEFYHDFDSKKKKKMVSIFCVCYTFQMINYLIIKIEQITKHFAKTDLFLQW